jgi:hypothetical protein
MAMINNSEISTMKKWYIIILISIVTVFQTFAQGKRVTGVVSDESGQPMFAVTVFEKGTTNGTTTRVNLRLLLEAQARFLFFLPLVFKPRKFRLKIWPILKLP